MSAPIARRVAIIGCGRMGRTHAERIVRDGRGIVVAVYDPDESAARRLVDDLSSGARVHQSLDQLLDLSDVDAAVICTPTTSHCDQVLACRERGWQILCEKPLAESRERIVALIEEARRGGPLCMLAYQRRFWSTYRTLRREVQSGKWGAIRAVTSHNVEKWEQTIAGTWRDDPRINIGGFVGDAGNHKLDLLFYVTGLRVEDVSARSFYSDSRVPIQTAVSGRLEGGALLAMDFIGNAQHLAEDFHVHCERADLMVRDRRVWIARDNAVEPVDEMELDTNPVVGFFDALDGLAENLAPFDSALPVWDLLSAIMSGSKR